MQQMGAFMNTTSDLFDKSANPDEKSVKKVVITNCQYRHCLKPLSAEKIRRHAEHCDKWCYRKEAKLKIQDKLKERAQAKENAFRTYHREHPGVYKTILCRIERLVVEGVRHISMRAIFGYVLRMQKGIIINDSLSPFYVDFIIERHPVLHFLQRSEKGFKKVEIDTKSLFDRRRKKDEEKTTNTS